MELADNITERYQSYKMNKIKCFSSNSSHFNWIILKITQYYNSPNQVLHPIPHISMQGELWHAYLGSIFSIIKQLSISSKMCLSSATN